MKSVGLREINQAFSRYMKIVKTREDALIVERERPAAVIKPVAPETDNARKTLHLEAGGSFSPPRKRGQLENHPPISLSGESLSQMVTVICDGRQRER